MTRLWFVIALVIVTSVYAWNNGFRLKMADYYSKKSVESTEWEYIPCKGNNTTDCGLMRVK
jgi:hypothetical protein